MPRREDRAGSWSIARHSRVRGVRERQWIDGNDPGGSDAFAHRVIGETIAVWRPRRIPVEATRRQAHHPQIHVAVIALAIRGKRDTRPVGRYARLHLVVR